MLDNPRSGFGANYEFQSSGLPHVTSSIAPQASDGCLRVDFPKVTRSITVNNLESSGDLRVGFTRNGVLNENYFLVTGGQCITFELRVKSIFIAGDTGPVSSSLCAGLTTISSRDMPELTGSLSDGSSGWDGVG